MNKSSKYLKIISIGIVGILILAGVAAYLVFESDNKDDDEQPEDNYVLDDRISPLVNQALVLEVLRIRHRGLYDELTTPGGSWDTPPSFYFISNMDGLEYVSKDIRQHSTSSTVLFNTWDTMFQENKIVKDAEEGQETSTVSLELVEVVPSGILGRKTSDVVRDEFTVKYDYRTGRWAGDDNFKDYDGYGYYLGDTFEVWFNLYQMDYDRDYIPYWTEVNVLGTDPTVDDSNLDPDNDGIPTSWEWKWGYDPFTWNDHTNLDPDVDGIENIEEYKLAKYLADPYQQNVYVEVDFMEGTGFLDPTHDFPVECQQGIMEQYAKHNIKMMFDAGWPDGPNNGGGQIVPYIKQVSQDSGMISQFYYHYFSDERKGNFRYMIIGAEGGFNHPGKGNIYDCTFIPDYIIEKPLKALEKFIKIGVRPTKRGKTVALAAAAMHELGHSCGLSNVDFRGIDNTTYTMWFLPGNYEWLNYKSVMNYYWMYNPGLLDYSDGDDSDHDQDDWGQFFVATFQYNNKYVEEANIAGIPPVTFKDQRFVEGYTVDENLTNDFVKMKGDDTPVDPIKVDWKVLVKNSDNENAEAMDIKVFVKPDVPSAYWVLSCEGNLDSEGNMNFYSQNDLFDKVYNYLEKEDMALTLII